MKKKTSPNEIIHFHKKYEFFLSPLEFLNMVWVYRKEIAPELEKQNCEIQNAPSSFEDFLRNVRYGILDGDIKATEFNADEWNYFIDKSKPLFSIFKDAIDKSIRKPDLDQVTSARNSFADLLHLDDRKNWPDLESELIEGNISFHIKFN